MKSFLVVGLGRFGTAIAEELFRLGQEVLAMDTDAERVQKIAESVTYAMVGDAKDEAVLQSVGVRNFDCVVVSIGENIQDSIMTTVLAKEMGARHIIAKAKNPMHGKILEKVGADKVIYPETQAAQKLAQRMISNSIIDYIELSDHYSIVEAQAPRAWWGKTILELQIRTKYGVNILAIKEDDGAKMTISPGPDHRILQGQMVILLGESRKIGEITQV